MYDNLTIKKTFNSIDGATLMNLNHPRYDKYDMYDIKPPSIISSLSSISSAGDICALFAQICHRVGFSDKGRKSNPLRRTNTDLANVGAVFTGVIHRKLYKI